MVKYEYKKLKYVEVIEIAEAEGWKEYDGDPGGYSDNSDGILIGLNKIGGDGWELITWWQYYFYFKRVAQ